jgi:hypothetical protein
MVIAGDAAEFARDEKTQKNYKLKCPIRETNARKASNEKEAARCSNSG